MRVVIDSYQHFMLRKVADGIQILEFPDLCPAMGDRDPYQIDEGELIAEIPLGAEVEFVNVEGEVIYYGTVCLVADKRFDRVICGDDFYYDLANLVGKK